MTARFMEEQPPARVVDLKNGYSDVFICLNPVERTEPYETEEGKTEQTYLEYDYNEFREKTDVINVADIMKHAENYLDYIPKADKTIDEIVVEQQHQIDVLTNSLLEMSEMLYA